MVADGGTSANLIRTSERFGSALDFGGQTKGPPFCTPNYYCCNDFVAMKEGACTDVGGSYRIHTYLSYDDFIHTYIPVSYVHIW